MIQFQADKVMQTLRTLSVLIWQAALLLFQENQDLWEYNHQQGNITGIAAHRNGRRIQCTNQDRSHK